MVPLTEAHPGEEATFLIRDSLTLYGLTLVANNDFLAENPEAVRGFLRAWAKGMKFTIDNPEDTIAHTIESYDIYAGDEGRAAVEWMVEKTNESWLTEDARGTGLLTFTDAGWTATKDTIVGAGLTNGQDIDISNIYTDEFLPSPPIMP